MHSLMLPEHPQQPSKLACKNGRMPLKPLRRPREDMMSESPVDTLMAISMGFTMCRSLHVIVELGIADALGETPLSADALARATGTHPDALNRVLRVLSA